jgi:hypothetical protein
MNALNIKRGYWRLAHTTSNGNSVSPYGSTPESGVGANQSSANIGSVTSISEPASMSNRYMPSQLTADAERIFSVPKNSMQQKWTPTAGASTASAVTFEASRISIAIDGEEKNSGTEDFRPCGFAQQ